MLVVRRNDFSAYRKFLGKRPPWPYLLLSRDTGWSPSSRRRLFFYNTIGFTISYIVYRTYTAKGIYISSKAHSEMVTFPHDRLPLLCHLGNPAGIQRTVLDRRTDLSFLEDARFDRWISEKKLSGKKSEKGKTKTTPCNGTNQLGSCWEEAAGDRPEWCWLEGKWLCHFSNFCKDFSLRGFKAWFIFISVGTTRGQGIIRVVVIMIAMWRQVIMVAHLHV